MLLQNKTTLRLLRLVRRHKLSPVWAMNLVFWFGALLVGLAAVLLAILCHYADTQFHHWVTLYPKLPLLITPPGFVLLAYLTNRYFSGAEGSGIPQAINALRLKEHEERTRMLSLRLALGKFLAVPAFLLGASTGREGPTIQAAASIMLSMSRFIKFKMYDVHRALVLAGGAAGIAAAFNAPLAGVVFAIEELGKSFEHHMSETILLTVLISGVVSTALLGNHPYFGLANGSFDHLNVWWMVIVCGVVGGLLGGAFSAVLLYAMRFAIKVYQNRKRLLILAAVCGVVVAVIGVLSDGVTYGSGYEQARQAMAGMPVSAGFPVWKVLATLATYISGIPAGIFAPSLAVGASIGHQVAQLFAGADPVAMAVMMMTAYFCGVTQSPITSFAIIMEMVDRSDMMLALMAVSLIAKLVSSMVCREPIYEVLAEIMRDTMMPNNSLLHKTLDQQGGVH